jgi:hypothetical protein
MPQAEVLQSQKVTPLPAMVSLPRHLFLRERLLALAALWVRTLGRTVRPKLTQHAWSANGSLILPMRPR